MIIEAGRRLDLGECSRLGAPFGIITPVSPQWASSPFACGATTALVSELIELDRNNMPRPRHQEEIRKWPVITERRQQKRVAKQKAKRAAKRSKLDMRTSIDPNVRLQSAEKWPVVSAVVSTEIWNAGSGPWRSRGASPKGSLSSPFSLWMSTASE